MAVSAGFSWRTIKLWEGGSKTTSPGPPTSLQVDGATRPFSRSAKPGPEMALSQPGSNGVELQFEPFVVGVLGGHLNGLGPDDTVCQP